MIPLDDARIQRGATGGIVAAAWIAGLYAASPLVGGFGIAGIAQRVINLTPGWFSSTMIGLLGSSTQTVLLASIVFGIMGAAVAVGVVWPRFPRVHDAVAIAAGVLASALLFVSIRVGLSAEFLGGVIIAVAPPYLAARLLGGPPTETGTDADRRGFLGRVVAVVGGGVLSLGALRVGAQRLGGPDSSGGGQQLPPGGSEPTEEPTGGAEPTEEPAEESPEETGFDFEGMPQAVTPPEEHYVVDISLEDPTIDTDSWTLDIDGVVSDPYSLTHEELLERDDPVEMIMTMLCISNRVGGDLIGTARWTGVQLSDLIDAADPDETAVDVVTHADDGYSEAFPIEQVQREDILIAYGMGGRTLDVEHGFPARLLIPGRYGMKMTKWITDIEIVDADHEAYWESRGWNEEAIVNTMSYIRGSERNGDRVTVGGVAFGGLETGITEIAGVELSVDGRETWNDAELEETIAPHAWRRWKHEFEAPERQEFEFVCRATERDGTVQTEEESGPRPDGSTGWHSVTETL